MNKLAKFANKAIDLETVSSLKGGVFCDIYLGHVQEEGKAVDPRAMQWAVNLDRIAQEDGFTSALWKGGGLFLIIYK